MLFTGYKMTRTRAFVFILVLLPAAGDAVLHRVSLGAFPEAVCSDGSPAAYYRSHPTEKRNIKDFVIYLEGGGYCHDINSCEWRCGVMPHLCTTASAQTIDNQGVLSDSPDDNPHFHSYFKVDLPYCTSDMYIGRRPASMATKGQNFLGRRVLTAMIKSMIADVGLDRASRVIFGGSSAGGAGVAFNCDYLKELLPKSGVYCVVDAAFFYPMTHPFKVDRPCDSIDKVLKAGSALWDAPEPGNLDLQHWWGDIKQTLMIGIAKFDQFGLESFCGKENSENDLDLWDTGIMRMARGLIRHYPRVGLFMPGYICHVMLNDNKAFGSLAAGINQLTYSDTLYHLVNGSGPIHSTDQCSGHPQECRLHC